MSQICVAKLVIETQSPMAITTGQRETGFDTALVRDINGLPMIPASAIAGVWRQLTRQHLGETLGQQWFGNGEQSSRLTISHGVIHNQKNQPISAFIAPDLIQQDAILSVCVLERPYHRERVAINDRGVAIDGNKFDQIVLPKGVRFSLTVHWNKSNDLDHQALFSLWHDRQMAFGSSTRNGLGKIKLIASEINTFDLMDGSSQGAALQHYLFNAEVPTVNNLGASASSVSVLLAQLSLKALDNWRCGSGSDLVDQQHVSEHKVAITTYAEPCWEWQDDCAHWVAAKPVLCGSSIKGILAHRVAYHYRKRSGLWADDMTEASHAEWETRPEALKTLFGYADPNHHDASLAGILMVDDADIAYEKTIIRHHNTIDRFTGGVRKGALYSEELLYQPCFTLTVWLKSRFGTDSEGTDTDTKDIDENIILALLDTLDDLQMGVLPMGAGSGRGTSLVMADPCGRWQVDEKSLKTMASGYQGELR